MATTVTAWVRFDPSSTNAKALLDNDAVSNVTPLIIRLHPSVPSESTEDFQLPYNPIQVRYGNLSDEMAQIERPGTTPIVAFKSHRLMTVDFSFILAQPGDGLATSIDESLVLLRRFAASGNRVVSLVNFDLLTNSPHTFRNQTPEVRTKGLFFNIVDMSLESVRRNKSNQISQANVTFSLVENRNPKINVVQIPPLPKVMPPKKCNKPKYRKANPDKCIKKKATDKIKVPSSTEVSRADAKDTLDAAGAGSQYGWPVGEKGQELDK